MHLLKAYFNYMEDPTTALKEWVALRPLSQALAGYLAAALGWVLFFNVGDGLSVASLLVKLVLVLTAEVTAGLFMAAFCGFFLDFYRQKVSAAELFCLVGSSGFIKSLLIVFALWAAMWPEARLGLLAPLAVVLVGVLQLGYLTRGLMRLYNLPLSKALSAWLWCFVPVGLGGALMGMFALWAVWLLV